MKNLTAFFWIEGCPAFYLWKVIIKYLFSLRESQLSTMNAHGSSGKARKYLKKTQCTRFSSRWICVKFLELYNDRCRIFLCIDHCKNHEKRTKTRLDKSGTVNRVLYVCNHPVHGNGSSHFSTLIDALSITSAYPSCLLLNGAPAAPGAQMMPGSQHGGWHRNTTKDNH